jgi:asparagine synthase (glutamine-hydrolysing)
LPGIAGIVDLDGKFDLKERITGMLSLMKHEPWYKVGQFYQNPIALGKASPGIIDPYPQPVFNPDKSLCLIMYGEVYNYPDNLIRSLKKNSSPETDNHPQIILNSIEKEGIEIVKALNGSFVLALWDFEKNRLTIANDRYGLRPLYYFWQNRLFIFASEMKSILTFSEMKKEVDLAGMAQFFSLNFIMQERTLLRGIKVLSPASILTFENGNLKKKTYWTLGLKENSKGFDRKDALNQAHFLVKQAVQRQLNDNVPKILSLSGGLDSRTILGASAQLGYKIPTFTFGISDCPDQKLAKAVADACRMENRFFELSPDFLKKWAKLGVWLTEGMNNCVNFHGIEFTPEIRKEAQIILNGFLGGELFGFVSFRAIKLLSQKNSKGWINDFFRQINYPFPESEQIHLFQPKYYSQIKGLAFQSFVKLVNDIPADSPFNKFHYFRFKEQAPKSFLYGLLVDNNLVEYRVPFCDYDLVDFVLTIPPREKALAIFHRNLLTEKFPPLGTIPYQRTGLPVSSGIARILFGKTKEYLTTKIFPAGTDKRRYLDYDNWMRNQLKDFLISILWSERFLNRGYFNPDYVKRMMERHLSGRQNLSSQLGLLLTFELWNQLFIDGIKNP